MRYLLYYDCSRHVPNSSLKVHRVTLVKMWPENKKNWRSLLHLIIRYFSGFARRLRWFGRRRHVISRVINNGSWRHQFTCWNITSSRLGYTRIATIRSHSGVVDFLCKIRRAKIRMDLFVRSSFRYSSLPFVWYNEPSSSDTVNLA